MIRLQMTPAVRKTTARLAFASLGILAGQTLAGCSDDQAAAGPIVCAAPEVTAYRIDHIDLPMTSTDARDQGLDIVGDGTVDNAGGALLAQLIANFWEPQVWLPEHLQAALDDGRVTWIVTTSSCPGTDQVSVTLQRAVVDAGGFRLAPDDARPAVGVRQGAHLVARDGAAVAPVSTLVDVLGSEPVVWVGGDGLAVDVQVQADGTLAGRLGLGLQPEHELVIARPLAAFFTYRLAEGGSELARALDVDHDGTVTVEEFLESQLMSVLLGVDVDLFDCETGTCEYAPDVDQVADRYSFGLRFHAVPVTLAAE